MYVIFKGIGFLIRQFLLPNPFESICPERAAVINLIFGIVLVPVAYIIVGRLYDRQFDEPVTGSLMFNVVYIVLTFITWGLLALFTWICDNWIVVLICTSVVVVIMVIVIIICKKKKVSQTKEIKNNTKKNK